MGFSHYFQVSILHGTTDIVQRLVFLRFFSTINLTLTCSLN